MKKKNGLLQLLLILAMVVCIGGCGAKAETETETTPTVESEVDQTQDVENVVSDTEETEETEENQEAVTGAYSFVANDVTIQVDADMDELLTALGESKSVFEAPSCAGEGISYLYNYSSFEIETYPAEDGKNRIGYIYLKDDMVATPEGIDLSMTKEDVILAYGEEYEELENKFVYEKEGTKLCFIFDGEQIIAIEYASAVIG